MLTFNECLIALLIINGLSIALNFTLWRKQEKSHEQFIRLETLLSKHNESLNQQQNQANYLVNYLKNEFNAYRNNFDQHQLTTLKILVDTLTQNAEKLDQRQ